MKIFLVLLLFIGTGNCKKLQVPRFATIKASVTNIRVGPAKWYPVLLQIVGSGLLIEIIAEYDQWLKIRDHESLEGWIHRSMVGAKRKIFVRHENLLHLYPSEKANPIAKIKSGVMCDLKKLSLNWCYVNCQGHEGWLPKTRIWGAYKHETKLR